MDNQELRARWRAATEDDVAAAIDASDMEDQLHGIAPVLLLEFFNRMLDEVIGEESD